MSIINRIFKARDKPKNQLPGSTYSFFFGSMSGGKTVNEHNWRTKVFYFTWAYAADTRSSIT